MNLYRNFRRRSANALRTELHMEELGYRIKAAGSNGFGIYEPIRTRLRRHEVEQ